MISFREMPASARSSRLPWRCGMHTSAGVARDCLGLSRDPGKREGGDCHILRRHPREGGDPVLRSLSVEQGACNWHGPMLGRRTCVYWVPAFAGMTLRGCSASDIGTITTVPSFERHRPQAGAERAMTKGTADAERSEICETRSPWRERAGVAKRRPGEGEELFTNPELAATSSPSPTRLRREASPSREPLRRTTSIHRRRESLRRTTSIRLWGEDCSALVERAGTNGSNSKRRKP
jgi:hypothetical protein